jgi:hypothetical protein
MKKMPDPGDVYPYIFNTTEFRETWKDLLVNVPNVRDGDGRLILPHEYRSKLEDETVVVVNSYLTL